MDDRWIHPEDWQLLLRILRWRRRWTQKQLATAAGMGVSSIYEHEKGHLPPRRIAEKVAAAAGYPLAMLEASLVPALAVLRLGGEGLELEPPPPADRFLATAAGVLRGVQGSLAAGRRGRGSRTEAAPSPSVVREAAKPLAATLARCTAFERQVLLERVPKYRGWAVVEALCRMSKEATPHSADRTLELAELGLQVAENVEPDGRPRKAQACGFALAYVGNARRVRNDLDGARAAFARAWSLWREGGGGESSPLEGWRISSLEASLRIDTQELDLALRCLDTARAQAPQNALGAILLKRARVFQQRGDFEAALAVLQEAEPWLDAEREPRHLFGFQFNRAVNLCHLGRFAAAEPLLPEIRARAAALRTELDLIRTSWIEARVAIGRGRTEAGMAALEQVAEEFRSRDLAYDGALVHLDLAVVELEQGKTAAVRERAAGMWWIFRTGRLHREAAAALDLFCQAARQEAVTVELARRIQDYLERAERNPALLFR